MLPAIEEPVVTPDSDVIQLAESGLTDEVLQWYRDRCDESLFFFNRAVLGYQDLTVNLHKPLCDFLQHSIPDRGRGVLMPRKFFKSTNVKGMTLWRLRNNANLRFLFVGENSLVGGKNLSDIRWHLQNNRLLRALYPNMIPAEGAKWTESEILLPRDKTFDEPTITTIGIGAKHTGFHYDIIVYDDPIGLVARDSPAEMNAAIEWFKAAQGLLDNPNSEEIIVGTRWLDGKGDLYGYIMEEMPFHRGTNGPEGYRWYFRQAIENGESIFPERYPLHELEKLRKRMGPYLWAANMMNDPAIPGNQDFPDEWIGSYTALPEGRGIELTDTKEKILYRNMVRVLVYDPSAGGKSASAENAIVVAGMDSQRRIFALEDWAANCGFAESIEKMAKLNDKWKVWKCFYEAVGAHKAVGEILKARPNGKCATCGVEHKKIAHEPINPPGTDKEERIRTLAQSAFEERRVYLRVGMEKLRRQITSFPFAPMVDRFDALAYTISKLRAPTSTEDIEDQRDQYARPDPQPRSHSRTNWGGYQ